MKFAQHVELQFSRRCRRRERQDLPQRQDTLWPIYVGLPLALVAFAGRQGARAWWRRWWRRWRCSPATSPSPGGGDGFPRYFTPVFVLVPLVLAQVRWPRAVAALALVALLPLGLRAWSAELHDRGQALCRRIGAFDGRHYAADREASPPACVQPLGLQSGPSWYSRRAPFACCGADGVAQWQPLHSQLCR